MEITETEKSIVRGQNPTFPATKKYPFQEDVLSWKQQLHAARSDSFILHCKIWGGGETLNDVVHFTEILL